MPISRAWCFTLNNPTDDELDTIRSWIDNPAIKTCFAGLESAPRTGTPHVQGYIKLTTPIGHVAFKRLYGFTRAHIEPARSGEDVNKRYCLKDKDTIIDKVSISMQGHRSDLDTLKKALDEGGLPQAKKDCGTLLIKYPTGCRLYCSITSPSTERGVRVCVFIGSTGTGKSMAAHANKPNFSCPLGKRGDPVWFDGYSAEPHLILDDFYGQFPWDVLLRVCDRYPLSLPIKGGFTGAHWTLVTITSNAHPKEWYPDKDLAPFADRIIRGNGKELFSPPYNYD